MKDWKFERRRHGRRWPAWPAAGRPPHSRRGAVAGAAARGAARGRPRHAAARRRTRRGGASAATCWTAPACAGPLPLCTARLPGAADLQPGDVVTTGTWTDAWPVQRARPGAPSSDFAAGATERAIHLSAMSSPEPQDCLAATAHVDSDHPAVRAFAQEHARGAATRAGGGAVLRGARRLPLRPLPRRPRERACARAACWRRVRLVRDQGGAARCGGARRRHFPRLGFADVRNHLSTERMRETMRTDASSGTATPSCGWTARGARRPHTFNLGLCERFGLLPLEFDGQFDSIYHPFDRSGQRRLEYLRERGSFRDLPLAQILADFRGVPALAARPRHAQCAGAGRLPGGRRARALRPAEHFLPPAPADCRLGRATTRRSRLPLR